MQGSGAQPAMQLRLHLLAQAGALVRRLQGGDMLLSCAGRWTLAAADREIDPRLPRLLMQGGSMAERLQGRLDPLGDALPGLGRELSQSWRWTAQP